MQTPGTNRTSSTYINRKECVMDAVIFFIPVALVVAQYLMPTHKNRSSVARDSHPEGCDA
jgi:hypothetical protein